MVVLILKPKIFAETFFELFWQIHLIHIMLFQTDNWPLQKYDIFICNPSVQSGSIVIEVILLIRIRIIKSFFAGVSEVLSFIIDNKFKIELPEGVVIISIDLIIYVFVYISSFLVNKYISWCIIHKIWSDYSFWNSSFILKNEIMSLTWRKVKAIWCGFIQLVWCDWNEKQILLRGCEILLLCLREIPMIVVVQIIFDGVLWCLIECIACCFCGFWIHCCEFLWDFVV